MKILVVDDSKAMRMIVVRTIKKAGFSGHTIIEAGNGAEALRIVDAQQPDVILSDWNMPEMNGIALLEALRAKGSKVRFGFVTSESSPDIHDRATQAGADFFITKPFTPENFEITLQPVLAG